MVAKNDHVIGSVKSFLKTWMKYDNFFNSIIAEKG